MWKEENIVNVSPDDLATELLPSNYIAKEIIYSVLSLRSQAFGFQIPPDDLRTLAKLYSCDPFALVEKASSVVSALNSEHRKSQEPKKKQELYN